MKGHLIPLKLGRGKMSNNNREKRIPPTYRSGINVGECCEHGDRQECYEGAQIRSNEHATKLNFNLREGGTAFLK